MGKCSMEKCPLFGLGQKTVNMPTYGEGLLKMMFVGEAPGRQEDLEGIPFIGQSGQLLRSMLNSIDLDLERHFYTRNAVSCRPPGNKEPSRKAIKACNSKLVGEIKRLEPRIVIALGSSACIALLGNYIDNITVTRFRNLFIPITELGFYFGATYHPSYVNRVKHPDSEFIYKTFKDDIRGYVQLNRFFESKKES